MKSVARVLVVTSFAFSFTLAYAQDIFMASYNGDLETVKRLIGQEPGRVNSRNFDGRFPLEMAAQTGQMDVVRFLLEKGADVHMARGGATALHMAAIYGGKTELIALLLERGADINARTANGATPLDLAVIGRQKKVAEFLLDRGGEMNLESQDFTRLLNDAASAGIRRIVDVALKKDIDFSFRTDKGNTLLHSAAEGGLVGLAELLLSKGLDMDTANVYGQTPLHFAARSGQKDIMGLFLRRGADINIKSRNGKSAFHLANDEGHHDVAEFLKTKGADASEWAFPKITGKFPDPSLPAGDPAIFAPGIVSAEEHFEHSGVAVSPDFTEVYWSTDFTASGFFEIVCMKKDNGSWSAPRLAPFSEDDHAGDPVLSHDGTMLYFSSTRPRVEGAGNSDENIWSVERIGQGWSEPKPLDERINTDKRESVLGITREGTLYLARDTEVFRSIQKSGVFQTPEKFELALNAGSRIMALSIAPDERYVILELMGDRGYGGADLYICFRMKDGSWSKPVNLGPRINTGDHERFPTVAPDGGVLFFLRVRDGSDIYWVDAKIIEDLRPRELKPE